MELKTYADILLIEDNPNDTELSLRALGMVSGHPSVLHLEDGVGVLDYIFATGDFAGRDIFRMPKMVMLDLKLPKIDGLEVLRRIRSDPRFHKLPILIFSSSKEESDLVKCYQLGANGYMVKPVSFDAFIKAVATMGEYWLRHNLLPREPFWSKKFDTGRTAVAQKRGARQADASS